MNKENKIGYYAVIPSTILFNEDLKANEKLLYAVITILANKDGYCFASNTYLAELFNAKPHTISNWISHLNKLNFVCVEIIKNNKNEIVQRRIYPNDTPYITKMTYPYSIEKTESMSQIEQYNNNINNKIERFFNYIVGKTQKNPEKFAENEEKEFRDLLEKLGFNYKEELIRIFTEENVKKVQIIIYALKRLFTSNRRNLIYKITREELLFIYDKCIEKQLEYENTEDEINNFLDYYYVSLINSLGKS